MKNYNEMTAKEQIEHDINGHDMIYSENGEHVNHVLRRLFRCWLDGSYEGEGHYRINRNYATLFNDDGLSMREFVITEFARFMEREYECTEEEARVWVKDLLGPIHSEVLYIQLVHDAMDLAE